MGKKAAKPKFKRAPGAPKRFKSAFMFYSESQHKLIRNNSPNQKIRAADVAKIVAQSWKQLPDAERAHWNEIANRDRQRFEREKAVYNGPWKVPHVKDPNAPKKPMSAFLAFGNERRKAIAEANPTLSNTEISHLLSRLWKECPDHIKQQYRDKEARQRQEFKKIRAEWERQKEQQQQQQQRLQNSSRESSPNNSMMLSDASLPKDAAGLHNPALAEEAFSLSSMATSVAISPNRTPIVHPISSFPPGKVSNYSVQSMFHQGKTKIGAAAATAGNSTASSTAIPQSQMKFPPSNCGGALDMSATDQVTSQQLFYALNGISLSGIAALDPTPMREPMQQQHQSSIQLLQPFLNTQPPTQATPADGGFSMEDAADLLDNDDDGGEHLSGDDDNDDDDGNANLSMEDAVDLLTDDDDEDDDNAQQQQQQFLTQGSAHAPFFPQNSSSGNFPTDCFSMPTNTTTESCLAQQLQQLQQQQMSNSTHMVSMEQMLNDMQTNPRLPLQLPTTTAGADVQQETQQRMAELARELGDDAVKMIIGAFRR